MSDLRALFSSSESTVEGAPTSRTVDTLELRRLVGAPTVSEASPVEHRFDRVTDLVGGPAAAPRTEPVDLAGVLGFGGVDARGQKRFIDQGTDGKGWQAPELAKPGRRPLFGSRRRAGAVNFISIAVATLAVVVVVSAVSVAAVQRVSANPADEAMVSLREREAELQNDIKAVATADELYAASLEEGQSLADRSGDVLRGLDGYIDAPTLTSANDARSTLERALSTAAQFSIPSYQRAPLDEKSLADVGEAIDDVRALREQLPPVLSDIREARAALVAALDGFRSQLRAVGGAIAASAAIESDTNDLADVAFRSAVADVAARVQASQLAGGDGLQEMAGYGPAVVALRTENERVEALRLEEYIEPPSRTPEREQDPQPEPTQPQPEPTQPAPQPTEPEPEPEPTQPQPEPTQPEPTEPQPEPTEVSPQMPEGASLAHE